jgi:antitoxin CcdA
MDKPMNGTALIRDADARRRLWLAENAPAFVAQAEWHARHLHPLSDILVDPKENS